MSYMSYIRSAPLNCAGSLLMGQASRLRDFSEPAWTHRDPLSLAAQCYSVGLVFSKPGCERGVASLVHPYGCGAASCPVAALRE